MRIDVMIAPFATATKEEIQALRLVQATLLEFQGVLAIWPPDLTVELLNDRDVDERALGLRVSAAVVANVAKNGGEAHVVGDRITEGMKIDLDAWKAATPRTATHYRLTDLL